MQDCFRQYPEIYGSELTDDGADEEQAAVDDSTVPVRSQEGPIAEAKAAPGDLPGTVESDKPAKLETAQSSAAGGESQADAKKPAVDN